AGPVLLLHADLLVGLDRGGLGAQPLLGLDAEDLRLLARLHGLDLALLLDLRVGLAALQLQDGLTGLHVLARDLLLLGALELVGAHVLDRRQLGDLADALRVEDVALVELVERGLLQVVDGRVLQAVAVEVGADQPDDLVTELVALGVEVDEVEVLAGRLERLGELGVEQLLQGPLVAGALGPDRLGDLDDVLRRLVHAYEERDLDVGADVVAADETLTAGAFDLDGLHRDVHDLGLVDDREDDRTGEGHVDLVHLGDDQGLALFDLPEQAAEQDDHAQHDDDDNGEEYTETRGDHIHQCSLS